MMPPIPSNELYQIPEGLIKELSLLYDYEARLVNSGENLGIQFNVSWTESELEDLLSKGGSSSTQAGELIDFLAKSRRLVRLAEGRFRTDSCELVRLSTFNYPRFVSEDDVMSYFSELEVA